MDTEREKCHKPVHRVRVAAGGRVVIPAEVRQGLGINEGDEVLLRRDGYSIHITTFEQTLKEVQEFFSQFKKPGESLVDELLRERREEASLEEREMSE